MSLHDDTEQRNKAQREADQRFVDELCKRLQNEIANVNRDMIEAGKNRVIGLQRALEIIERSPLPKRA